MESKLTKLKTFKQAVLTDAERNLMRAHAARIVIASPVLVTESFFKRGVQHGLRIALSSLIFVVFIGGSVSAVANNALPGDPLYSFKVNVNEEVKGLLVKTSPQEKIAFQQNRIETRVQEIQTLAASNSLTQAKQEIAAKALSSNVADLSTSLTTLSAQAPNSALTITSSLEQTLKANKAALESSPDSTDPNDTGKADAIKTVDATLQSVSNQEVQIISKEIDNINTAVTTVSTTNDTPVTVQPTTTASAAVSTQTPATPSPTITPSKP